ncbi:uncharacterized protein BCR38DRAFT_482704 [Pseudomassariella vexata]|uniref:Uncharacterized protein n=1 Tax=Pseudomassariella vexata TaxID=1141098 RepID=A0A1Y2E670_9PEZI|nr:uncharacterized protein BCR38DRAFT_482704 [Pseudomassariella vexata]ORY67060.1 hypothetical protein BCR38DRAFT_482704 [Pseudomassariella vexata]
MRFFNTFIVVACASVTTVFAADNSFNVSIYYQQNGQYKQQRVWFGDGLMYVGPTVPPSVKVAFNFTVPNNRADLLYILPVGSAPLLPDPTFLVLNNSAGATEPVAFAHTAADLPDYEILFWTRYEIFLFPIQSDGSINNWFFLGETEVPETYAVKWRTGGSQGKAPNVPPSGSLVGIGVSLSTYNL